MRILCLTLLLLWPLYASIGAQTRPVRRTPEDFGYRHLVVMFGKDSVDVLVLSPKGEAQTKKPLLLWVQGSLPKPLILYDAKGAYGVFPFLAKTDPPPCHIAIIGKPGVALVANIQGINPNRAFQEKTPPLYYCQRNYLDYYVRRNVAVLRYLKKQSWVDANRVIVGGHSEGSTVAAHLAAVPGLVSRAVYLSGNPLGRMHSNIVEARREEAAGDTAAVPQVFRYWRDVLNDPTRADCTPGDNNRTTMSFSAAPLPVLLRAKVPVFVGFGTRDRGVAGDDYLRLEAQRLRKTNFTFQEYSGREHNFFGFKDGQINYDDFYWHKVGADFMRWAGLL
ncbi:alpha/beta hydrolase family protein [Hymenobacter sp. B1770]|uniref:alpha/beta hydrolase family protein n=1 Tax=Hymenobacter sp. B1770 TaxID=1718788 RepID=UPI003CEB2E2B